MGLIKAITSAAGGVMADQWREYFYCDSLEADVLVTKGRKRTSGRSGGNNKGENNIISNGSVVAVNEGQCMMIVDQGKVVEFCAEAGNLHMICQQNQVCSMEIWGKMSKDLCGHRQAFYFWRGYGEGSESIFF